MNDVNLISDVFDYLNFDCSIRAFIEPAALDESIKTFYELKSVDALICVIDLILKGIEASCMKEEAFLNNVKAYIVEHLEDGITIEQVAREFHVSYYYLCHIFKKITNKTINQFKTESNV